MLPVRLGAVAGIGEGGGAGRGGGAVAGIGEGRGAVGLVEGVDAAGEGWGPWPGSVGAGERFGAAVPRSGWMRGRSVLVVPWPGSVRAVWRGVVVVRPLGRWRV
jgi:hypothetical protein